MANRGGPVYRLSWRSVLRSCVRTLLRILLPLRRTGDFLRVGEFLYFEQVPQSSSGIATDPQLGIFVDPCLRNGMREAWRSPTKPTLPPFMTSSGLNDSDYKGGVTEKTSDKQTEAVSMLPTLGYTAHGHGSSSGPSESNSNSNGDEQPGLDPNRRGSGNTDLEIEDALSALPNPDSEEQQRQQQQRDEQRRVGTGSTRPALEQSRSFRGVASDSLPDGLTDDVDADLTLEVAPWRRPSEGEMRVARGGEVNGYDDLDGLVRQL